MKWQSLKEDLRTPQINSLKLTKKYFISNDPGSCLIHMPTGSGKSGIIAVIANLQFNDCILIVTPRVSLSSQIMTAVEKKFFVDVLEKEENPKQKIFKELTSSETFHNNSSYKKHVYFSTVQKVDWIRKNNEDLYKSLTETIKLVIFDEGHYEPAISWSQTIRGFKTKKILFTATPFRNDLKTFDISEKFIYPYSYNKGLKDNYLREIHFKSEARDKDDDAFIQKIIAHYKFKFGDFDENSPKLIIRCSQMSTIVRLSRRIKELYNEINIISIHENFKSSEIASEQRTVPKNPSIHPAKIWIHQNKLLEGIDDSQFKMLAIYDDFKNDRALIQQIGRLVRISKNKEGEDYKAYVIDFSNGRHEEIWKKYLEFDKSVSKSFFQPMTDKILDKLLNVGEEYEYLLNGFKKKFVFNSTEIPEDLLIPLRTNFIEKRVNFNIEKFSVFIHEKLIDDDKVVSTKVFDLHGFKIHVYFCLSLSYSPYLADHYSLNLGNDLIVFFEFENVISYFDSTNFLPIGDEDLGLGKVTDNNHFKKVFNLEDSVISSVSLRNSNLGINSIRTHSISANSIDNTLSYLDDKSQIVSTASGKYKKEVIKSIEDESEIKNKSIYKIINRYIGLTTGRISQRGDWVKLDEYINWVCEIHLLMNDPDLKPKETFQRYSKSINTVEKTTPKHILLDIGEIEDDFKLNMNLKINGTVYNKNEPIIIEDVCSPVELNEKTNTYEFVIKVSDDHEATLSIEFDKKSKSYKIKGTEFDNLFQPNNSAQYQTVIRFLNQRQSFKIIPEEQNVIYAYGQFYQVHSHFGKGFEEENFNLKDVIIPIKEMDKLFSEKGKDKTVEDGNTWVPDSIFGFLDNLGKGSEMENIIGDPSIIICDDMGTEMADMIYAYEDEIESKIIFIHAKSGKDHQYSASAIQEVTSQATKNIKYLNSYNSLPESLINKWNNPWKSRDLVVHNRIRKPEINSKEAFERINKIIQNPNSSKEVWLVLSKTLQRSKLIEALKKPKPEAIQSTLLIHSTLQSVGTVNAKLKVFCSQ